VVDWSTAVRPAARATRLVPFANTSCLLRRPTSASTALEAASRSLSRAPHLVLRRRGLRRVEARVDNAMLYESVNNAVACWRPVARRGLADRGRSIDKWQQSVAHKLASLESIYEKVADESAVRRSELLELIIIGLIALEISWGSLFAGLRATIRGWFDGML
jgi:hypothetical protein